MGHRMLRVVMGLLVMGVAIAWSVSPAFAGSDRRVKIINETGHTMQRFYASHVGTDSWEEDILGEDVLSDGQSFTVNFSSEDYCLYDFKAVFVDGDELVRNRVNICEIEIYRYTE